MKPKRNKETTEAPYGERVARIERVTDPAMLVFAVVYVVAFVIGYLPELAPALKSDAARGERHRGRLRAGVFRVAAAERRLAYLKAPGWMSP